MLTLREWVQLNRIVVPDKLLQYEATGTRDKNIPHDELETILNEYYRSVVAPCRAKLSLPGLLMFDDSFNKIRHDKSNTWKNILDKADVFATEVNTNHGLIKPSELRERFPDMCMKWKKETVETSGTRTHWEENSWTKQPDGSRNHWQGRVDGWVGTSVPDSPIRIRTVPTPLANGVNAIPMYGRCSGPEHCKIAPGTMIIQDECKKEFLRGAPGSSWTGIVQAGSRSGSPHDIIYLIPSQPVFSHMTESHNQAIEIKPVVHGEVSSHNGALHLIIVEKGWAKIGNWNGFDAKDIEERGAYNETGIFFGFSIVKSYSERGHLFAFTSATLNKYACADPKPEVKNENLSLVAAAKARIAAQSNAGETDMPKDWALAVWGSMKDLP